MPEDDYDLEAAAKRLTESGFGQFEQAGEVLPAVPEDWMKNPR